MCFIPFLFRENISFFFEISGYSPGWYNKLFMLVMELKVVLIYLKGVLIF